jgi:hypothetical protein
MAPVVEICPYDPAWPSLFAAFGVRLSARSSPSSNPWRESSTRQFSSGDVERLEVRNPASQTTQFTCRRVQQHVDAATYSPSRCRKRSYQDRGQLPTPSRPITRPLPSR